MTSKQSWDIPAPPPSYVRSVRDEGGEDWSRANEAGTLWRLNGALETWDWLLHNRGRVVAVEMVR